MEADKKYIPSIPQTYGPNRFSIPKLEQKLRALGYDDLKPLEKQIIFEKSDEFWEEIAIPRKSDWLWDHKEGGQTFKSYSTGMINQPSKSHQFIFMKNMDEGLKDSFLTKEMMNHLKGLLEVFYPGLIPKILEIKGNFETLGVTKRENPPYLQYHAEEGINKLVKLMPKEGLLIIGLTAYDIYPNEDWNFVFGLADKEKGCGLFSFRRYFDEMKCGELELCKLAGKVMLHEVGHLLGLKHCIYYSCIMNGSNHLEENIGKPFEFCPVCLRKVWWNLKFDIIERYENICKTLIKLGKDVYSKEINWYEKRFGFLRG